MDVVCLDFIIRGYQCRDCRNAQTPRYAVGGEKTSTEESSVHGSTVVSLIN
jgi:hypothetical protein